MSTGNPAAPFTTAVFAVSCLLGGGLALSCQRLATKPGECIPSFVTGAAIVVAGAAPKAANDAGFQTDNPALDGARKARILEQLQAEAKTEGPPVDLPPEPDWLGIQVPLEDAIAAFDEEPPIIPVARTEMKDMLRDSFREAVSEGIVEPLAGPSPPSAEPEEDEPLAVRMARAAAKLQRQGKA